MGVKKPPVGCQGDRYTRLKTNRAQTFLFINTTVGGCQVYGSKSPLGTLGSIRNIIQLWLAGYG